MPGPATLHAAGGPEKPLLSVRITSPLGRLGLPGAIRIVAQVNHPPKVALGSVRFYVNDTLVGDDREGPPYAVEWTDANPFEPTRIRVDASDALGNIVSDAIELAPFEILETTGVSRVLLEATVMDKSRSVRRRPGRRLVPRARERRAADDRPRQHRIAAGDLHPARGREPEHARQDGVRSHGRRAAGRLPADGRSHHRGAVCEVAWSDHRANRRSRHDRGRGAGDLVQWRHGNLRRPDRGFAARAGHRSAACDRAHHRWVRRAQPGEDGGRSRRGAVGARRRLRDRRRRRRRHLAERRARAQADRPADRRAGVLSVAGTGAARRARARRGGRAAALPAHLLAGEPGCRRGMAAHHGPDDRLVAPHPDARRLLRAEAAAGAAVARVHRDRRQP